MHANGEHLTAKDHVDQAVYSSVDEPTLVRKNQDFCFNIFNLINIKNFTLNTQAIHYNQVITKSNVDQFHQDKKRSRRDLGIDFFN